jgi:thiamine biosynthesis lipoprotein
LLAPRRGPWRISIASAWLAARFELLIVALSLLLGSCGEQIHKQQSYVFGTLVEVTIWGEDDRRAQDATNAVLHEFDRLHNALHAWKPSALSTLNGAFAKGEKLDVDAELSSILADATRFAEASDESFNPAIGKLVRLWGFHADEFKPVRPDIKEIQRLVQANPRMTDIATAGNTAFTNNPSVQIDLGGYAKGYALDRAVLILRERRINNALVNIGGNIIALGTHGDRPWRVGIQHPRKPGPIATLALHDGEAIGTSGDYQRYFEQDGKRYCHIIDPKSGYPVQEVQAVTVIAPPGPQAGTISDVASKPLFIARESGWRAAAARMAIEEALLVDGKGEVHLTARMAKRLEFSDPKTALHRVP